MKNMHNPLLAGEAVVSFQPEVTIETDMKSGIYYIPYNATAFPEDAEPFYDAYVKNPSQQTNYTVPYVLSRSPLQNSAYDAFVHETYTQVPDETRQALSDILSELVGEEDADPYQYIPRVLEYVSTSARYDLNTLAVPDGEDFGVVVPARQRNRLLCALCDCGDDFAAMSWRSGALCDRLLHRCV